MTKARVDKYQKVDMVTDIGDTAPYLCNVDGGRLIFHGRALAGVIRENASKPEGKLAIAMVDEFDAVVIASIFDGVLPNETMQYFRTPNENIWKLKEPMCRILRPYMFDEDGLYDPDEMKSLGIPTWLEIIQTDFPRWCN
jgi:hypothetical protein